MESQIEATFSQLLANLFPMLHFYTPDYTWKKSGYRNDTLGANGLKTFSEYQCKKHKDSLKWSAKNVVPFLLSYDLPLLKQESSMFLLSTKSKPLTEF